ncbi:MAG: exosortase/archaeosortase family protein [Tepidisphaeraceae bacterium]|jgi:exosortase
MYVVSRNTWRPIHVAAALVMIALGVVVTFKPWADMYFIASKDEEASQMWLVFPVAAWLVWVRRGRLRGCRPMGSLLGPAIVAIGWILSTVGFYRSVQAFWHFGAVLVPLGGFLSVVGRDLIRRFMPAFLVLVFLVPIPGRVRQSISGPMMRTTAAVTEQVSDFLGVPVDRSGNQLCINGHPVNIEEACNGLRMVFSLLLVSYAFAFGEPLRNYVRALILLASPLSAMACNVVRMVPTLWMYGYAAKSSADRFHDMAGWVMLVVAFLLLMSIIRILQWAMLPVRHFTLAGE